MKTQEISRRSFLGQFLAGAALGLAGPQIVTHGLRLAAKVRPSGLSEVFYEPLYPNPQWTRISYRTYSLLDNPIEAAKQLNVTEKYGTVYIFSTDPMHNPGAVATGYKIAVGHKTKNL